MMKNNNHTSTLSIIHPKRILYKTIKDEVSIIKQDIINKTRNHASAFKKNYQQNVQVDNPISVLTFSDEDGSSRLGRPWTKEDIMRNITAATITPTMRPTIQITIQPSMISTTTTTTNLILSLQPTGEKQLINKETILPTIAITTILATAIPSVITETIPSVIIEKPIGIVDISSFPSILTEKPTSKTIDDTSVLPSLLLPSLLLPSSLPSSLISSFPSKLTEKPTSKTIDDTSVLPSLLPSLLLPSSLPSSLISSFPSKLTEKPTSKAIDDISVLPLLSLLPSSLPSLLPSSLPSLLPSSLPSIPSTSFLPSFLPSLSKVNESLAPSSSPSSLSVKPSLLPAVLLLDDSNSTIQKVVRMPDVPQLSMSTVPSSMYITTTVTTATSSLLSLPPIIMNTKKHYGDTNNNVTNNQSIPIKTISDNNNNEMKRITPSPSQEELQQEEEVVVAAVSSSQNEMIPFITRSCLKDFIHPSSSSTNTDNNNNNINNEDIDLIFTFAVETKMEILPTKAASTTVSSSSSSPFLSSKDVLYNYHLRQNTNNIHLSNILIDNIAHYLLRNCNNDDGNDNDNDDDDDDSDEELLLSLENSTSSLMTSSLSTLSSSTSSSSSSIVVKDTKEKMNKMNRNKFQKKKNGNEILLKTKISVIYYSKHDGLLDIASCASIHPQATHCKIVRAHLKLGKSYNAVVDTTNTMMDENAIINLALKGLQNDMNNGHIIDSILKTQEKKSSSLSAESKSSTFLPSTDHLMNLRYLGPNIKFNHIFNDLEQEGGGIFNIGDTLINNLPKESNITSQKGNNNTIYNSKRIVVVVIKRTIITITNIH